MAEGRFETEELLAGLAKRIGRDLRPGEVHEIEENIEGVVKAARQSALGDDAAGLMKTVSNRLNDIVLAALFRSDGLGIDQRSHRALWSLGEDFKTWAVVHSHPEYDGWLIYRTASLELTQDGMQLARVEFDHGLKQTGEGFLGKLYAVYQKLQARKGNTFVPAWELRAVFCYDHRCQLSVFDNLFDKAYGGSDEFKLQLEIQRAEATA